MNFLLPSCTFLRYFMPLIIEGDKYDIKSTVYWFPNSKYDNPEEHLKYLEFLSKKYNFSLKPNKEVQDCTGITFTIEGVRSSLLDLNKNKLCVLTSMQDFKVWYPSYVSKANYIFMPSRFIANYHYLLSEKNLYLGSPKYDINLSRKGICEKYDLPRENKYALIIASRQKYNLNVERMSMSFPHRERLYQYLKNMGYTVIIKTRGKDIVPIKDRHCDYYFEDFSWFPHSTMELIYLSEIVFNYSSSAIKECVMLERPVINFDIKNKEKSFDFLYGQGYVRELPVILIEDKFQRSIEKVLEKIKLDPEIFKRTQERFLFVPNNVSKKILEVVHDKKFS